MKEEDWILEKDRIPQEEDGLFICTNGNGFYEIMWYCKSEDAYKKPFAFDEDDLPAFRNGKFTHWMPIVDPK
jgi:hypothetical protein